MQLPTRVGKGDSKLIWRRRCGSTRALGTALPRWPFVAGTWTLVAVFLGRVVGDFRVVGLFKRLRGTAFAWWDAWLFVPLVCFSPLDARLLP